MRRCSLSAALLVSLIAGPLCGCASTGSGGFAASRGNRIETQYQQARLAESDNHDDKAREIYEKLYKQDASNANVCHRLGMVHARQSEFASAKLYLNEARRLRPSDPEILNDLGYVCFLTNDLSTAEGVLNDALRLDPGNHRATHNLALVAGTQGRYDESFRLFRQVNKESEALANIAYLQAQQGEGKQALEHYNRALSLDPELKNAANPTVEIAVLQRKMEVDRAQLARLQHPGSGGQQVSSTKPIVAEIARLDQVVAAAQSVEHRPAVAVATEPAAEAQIASVVSADNPFSDNELTSAETTAQTNFEKAAVSVVDAPVITPGSRSKTVANVANAVSSTGVAVDYVAICPQADEQVRALLTGLNTNDPSQIKPALHKLGELADQATSAEPALRAALKHPEIVVRIHAALALWRIRQNTELTVPVFIEGLQHPDADVRSFAATVLAMGPRVDTVVAPLTTALSDSNAFVRIHAAETLYQYPGKQAAATEVLLTHLNDKDANVRWLATFIVGEILPKSDLVVQSLTRALQDQDNRIRAGAAFALGGLGPQAKPALPELKKLVTDNQPEVREAAEEAVRDIEHSTAQASAK